jgi:hypothetical protein
VSHAVLVIALIVIVALYVLAVGRDFEDHL